MAKIIKTDGTKIEVAPANGSDFSLEELQKVVGGYIEIVYLSEGRLMVVNEEGWLNNLPYNPSASEIYGHPIVGDVLICERKQIK